MPVTLLVRACGMQIPVPPAAATQGCPLESAVVEGAPVGNPLVLPQQRGHMIDGFFLIGHFQVQIDVLGMQDIRDGDHKAVPLHFSFWRNTSKKETPGSTARGTHCFALRMYTMSPVEMAMDSWPSTVT